MPGASLLRSPNSSRITVMYEGTVIEDEDRADVLWGTEMENSYYSREEQEGRRWTSFLPTG